MSYKTFRSFVTFGITVMLLASLMGCSANSANKNNESTEATPLVDSVSDASSQDKKETNLSEEYDASSATLVTLEQSYTIKDEGTYVFSGELSDGQILVDAAGKKVQIVLNQVDITCSNCACIYVKKADQVSVTLAENSINHLTTTEAFEADGEIKVDGVIFSKADLVLNGSGTLQITSNSKNGVVSKDSLEITNGSYYVEAASHAFEANDELTISGGHIEVAKSYEGLEAEAIYIKGGEVDITASDDGINAAGGDNNLIEISDGTVKVNADGDGLDSNGSLLISGGYTLISGPTNNGNSALDFESTCTITGGTLIATGSSGMVEAISSESTQVSVTLGLSEYVESTFSLCDSNGKEILSITPEKKYNCIIVSSPELQIGQSYTLTAGSNVQELEISQVCYSNIQGMGPGSMGPGGTNRPDKPQNMDGSDLQGGPQDGGSFDGQEPPQDGKTFGGQEPPQDGKTFGGQEPPQKQGDTDDSNSSQNLSDLDQQISSQDLTVM